MGETLGSVPSDSRRSPAVAAWTGVSMAFAALGRVFICLDRDFRIIHASHLIDQIAGEGAASRVAGLPVEDVLGAELFGQAGVLRLQIAGGERREGWRAWLRVDDGPSRLVSVSAAPFPPDPSGVCDPRVAYVVVMRPAADEGLDATATTTFAGMLARSEPMLRVFRLIQTIDQSEATVLLSGESGTGKERVAHAIHAHSLRRLKPFVAVNCGALPGDLLESEMFGHVRGAFTGAVRDRVGRFELAEEGTLFLDEVGDLQLPLQVKLLRVLQEHSFERVGESTSRRAEARIVAATNLDLQRAVREGRFREDLYYRLRVVPIDLPPLRERREDIEPLANHLLARVAERRGRALRLSPDALRALIGYSWPGNVRELENALEYAVAVATGQTVLPEDLPIELSRAHDQVAARSGAKAAFKAASTAVKPPDDTLRAALDAHHWHRVDAARSLGISRSTLWRRMREAGLAH